MTLRKLTLASVTAAALSLPLIASADSDLGLGAPTSTSANADLDFQIVIPSFIYFQVGSGGNTVDLVNFDLGLAVEEPGSTNSVAGNAGSGVIGVDLRSNAASVQITATGGALNDGGANNIPLTEISVAAGGTIPAPDFGASTGFFPVLGGVLSDTWTFTYDNNNVYPPGTYGGAGTGTVTYTAADF